MTKMKSKKMTKSTFAIIIMGIVMVAMLAFGGTFAYFTATTTEKSATATTGTVKLSANTMATLNATGIVSGSELIKDGTVQVTNASNVETWIFVTFEAKFDGAGEAKASAEECKAEGDYYLAVTGAEDKGWTKVEGATNVFGRKATADDTTLDVCSSIKFYGYSQSTEAVEGAGSLMNKTITVTVSAKSIQALGENGAAMEMADAYALVKA